MSDDLVVGRITFLDARAAEIVRLESALEAKDKEIERLRAERDKWDRRVAYDELAAREYENRARQQRQIDDLTVRAEQAERTLAEAVELIDQLSSFQISETLEKTGKLSDLCKAWIEHKKFARQFVKEHSANADQ